MLCSVTDVCQRVMLMLCSVTDVCQHVILMLCSVTDVCQHVMLCWNVGSNLINISFDICLTVHH